MTLTKNQYKIRKNIRNNMRTIRKNMTEKEQKKISQKIAHYIINDKRIKKAKYIGLFITFDGEIKTDLLIKELIREGKKIYLPKLHKNFEKKTLLFSQYTLSTHLTLNKFKIYEPEFKQKSLLISQELDILFIPLVAFDNNGNRLGMGKGFYDYTLMNWNNNTKNLLIGLAYDFQQTNNRIPTEKWDIPLPEIITQSSHWIWENKHLIKLSNNR